MIKYALLIILILNLIAFVLMGIDKRRAINGKSRIPESTLLFWGFLMGGPGLLLGSLVFHHKTRKAKFRFGLPLILLVQIALIILLRSLAVTIEFI